jgi:hypothetical protein
LVFNGAVRAIEMESVVPLSGIVLSASAGLIEAAHVVLNAPHPWPDSTTGFAHRIFERTGTSLPEFMLARLRPTSAALLRRTPELAAFGYVLRLADPATLALWIDAVEHLRGREIYPADRQSFIFNPVEILGVGAGLVSEAVPGEHREWLADTVLRGMKQGQFRTPLSQFAAHRALELVDASKAAQTECETLDIDTLGTADLVLAAAISFGFGAPASSFLDGVELALLSRVLKQPFVVGDAVEAATLAIVSQRAIDRVILGSAEGSAEERILALCRRFPLFVERLQARQRNRPPITVEDEYDVQDFLHGILKLHFDDVRPEEVTPSYAGNTSRVDFFLPRERIVVEAKKTRDRLGQREVANELIIDAARYSKMDGVDTLICVVYDPERRCSSPTSLENDVAESGARLKVRAVVCPHGL